MNKIIKFMSIVSIQVRLYKKYRINTLFGILVSILQVLIVYYIWKLVYIQFKTKNVYNDFKLIEYIIISTIIMGRMTYGVNRYISKLIESGDIITELLKPVDFQIYYFFRRFGDFLSSIIFEGIPALLVVNYLINIRVFINFNNTVVFIFSLLFALLISYNFEFIIGICSFYTKNGLGLQTLKLAIVSFFSGALFPLEMIPQNLQFLFKFSPFKGIVYIPTRIFIDNDLTLDTFKMLMFQVIWVIVLTVLSKMLFKRTIKIIEIQGG